jgi:hypothetical protein
VSRHGHRAVSPRRHGRLSDDGETVWFERESARRANPPEVFEAFEREWRVAAIKQYGPDAFASGEIAQRFVERFGPG